MNTEYYLERVVKRTWLIGPKREWFRLKHRNGRILMTGMSTYNSTQAMEDSLNHMAEVLKLKVVDVENCDGCDGCCDS